MMLSELVIFSVILFLICLELLHLYQNYSRHFKLLKRIPGPDGIPLLGNALMYVTSREKQFEVERHNPILYAPIYKLWILHVSAVYLVDPDDVEIVLTSTSHIKKSRVYDNLKPWLGTGLLTSFGKKWSMRRKLLTPAFHFAILTDFVKIFNECTLKFVDNIQKNLPSIDSNVVPQVTQFTLDSIVETAMGAKLMESAKDQKYKEAVKKISEVIIRRMTKPWLYNEFIYNLTSDGRKSKVILKTLHEYTKNIIHEKKHAKRMNEETRKKLAMLDLLLEHQAKGADIDDEGLREEVDTFMFEGHDTTAIAISMIFLVLANYPKEQEGIRQEIIQILGESINDVPTYNDLQELTYTERCIKECLRLFPSVPMIGREATEDIYTKTGYIIPKGAMIHIQIFDIHRNHEIYPDPEKFDPDRFLPENCVGRHPFAYIPFSAGPRNCIGQRFAISEIKSALCGILRQFKLEPIDRVCDVKFTMDLVLRPSGTIRVKFVPIR